MNNIRQQIHDLPPAARENIIMRAIVPGIRKGLTFDLAEHEIIEWLLDIVEDAHDHICRVTRAKPIAPPAPEPETPTLYCIIRRLDDAPEDAENRWLLSASPVTWHARGYALISYNKAQLEEIAKQCNGIVAPFNGKDQRTPWA